MSFTHLHLHTEYSLLDGACRIPKLVERIKALGMTSCAITDHGVMYGCIDFYSAMKDAGIKPIIGCEVYVCRDRLDKSAANREYSHLILLCENNTGYQNLMKLVSEGFLTGYYYRPRIDYNLIRQHSEGLICLSACLSGDLPKLLLQGRYDDAEAYVREMQDIFGEKNFYVEIMDHGIREEKIVMPRLISLAREMNVPLVATNDCHYLEEKDADAQEVLLCIQTGKTLDDANRMRMDTRQLYVKSEDEMRTLFAACPDAVDRTQEIADRCNVEFEFGVTRLPHYPVPEGETALSMLTRLTHEGLRERYPDAKETDEPWQRLNYELNVISSMGYVDYFLIVWDFIRYAKSQGIMVGPGRGSGAGSIVAYSLGITMLDPLKYQLLFERFLNPERVTMPDIDVDFCYERRQEVIDYVARKYGADHVSQIITFGTLQAKGCIRDVGRVLGMSYQDTDAVAKAIPFDLGMTLEKALTLSPLLKTMYDEQPEVHRLIDTAMTLEGMPRHASTHAAGVVITKLPVYEYVPLARNDDAVVCQYVMTTLEELGLLKMDFLGLRNLTVLDDAVKMVQQREPEFALSKIPDDDAETYDMISRGQTAGVFQIESTGMTGVCVGLKPQSIEDITAVIALYRPGPMESIPRFIACKHDPKLVTYKHPRLVPILSVTYGCIVYQEQVIRIFQELGGFSLGQADMVRRAISKKKAKEIEKERQAFVYGDAERGIKGCIANGIDEKTAQAIYDEIYDFANYALNKAHAVSYAVVAYQTAYFKCHYTKEYMAALLTSVLDNSDKVAGYIGECRDCGIALLPPDVNRSSDRFTVEPGGIRFGLVAIKNIGRGFIQSVVREREQGGSFTSLQDFCDRMYDCGDMNKRAVENLIRSGAFDSMGARRSQLLAVYEKVLDGIGNVRRRNVEGQIDFFGMSTANSTVETVVMPDIPEFTATERMHMEKETTGLYLSGHPMVGYRAAARSSGAVTLNEILEDVSSEEGPTRFADGMPVTVAGIVASSKTRPTKNGTLMAYVVLEDETASMELLCFSRVLERCGSYLAVNSPVLIKGRLSLRDEKPPQIMPDVVFPMNGSELPEGQKAPENGAAAVYLRVKSIDDPAFSHLLLVATMFEGKVPLKIRIADTGKLWGGFCLDHPAFLKECREWLGPENVVVRRKEKSE